MKAIVFSPEESQKNQIAMKDFLRTCRLNSIKLESYDPNSRRGSELAQVYGAMDYPAVVLLSEEGAVLGFWQGRLPGGSEITGSLGYL